MKNRSKTYILARHLSALVCNTIILVAVLFCLGQQFIRAFDLEHLGYLLTINKAYAGDDAEELAEKAQERARENAKKLQELQREQAKQAQEKQREQAKKAQERQREQAEKAQEGQREQAEKAQERGREETKQKSESRREQEPRSNRSKSRDDRRRDDDEDLEDQYPPSTVVELLKRLTKPKRKLTKPKRKKPRIRFGSGAAKFLSTEILAKNITPGSIQRARRLGFQIERGVKSASLNAIITRLIAPPGWDARKARDLLKRTLPKDSFAFNRRYRLYRAARGRTRRRRQIRAQLQKPGRRKCLADQCYATSLMGWRQPDQACVNNVRVGVIDTSIDHRHPAFLGERIHVGQFASNLQRKTENWHGTGVLALLAGNPNTTTPGLIPNARFFVADIFFADKEGFPVADSVSMLKALDWLDAFGVNVVNISISGPRDSLVEKAIQRLSKKGIVFVAAAGNNGPAAPPSFPAAYKEVIAVTAIDKKLRGYRYANRGAYIDVAAPGVGIWTAMPGHKEGYRSGTSFAAPFVTAVVATLYRRLRKRSRAGLLASISTKDLGKPGKDQIYGRGLITAPRSCQPEKQKFAPRRNNQGLVVSRRR